MEFTAARCRCEGRGTDQGSGDRRCAAAPPSFRSFLPAVTAGPVDVNPAIVHHVVGLIALGFVSWQIAPPPLADSAR